MESSTPLIDQLFDPEFWSDSFNALVNWLQNAVFVESTLIGIAAAIVGATIAWWLSRKSQAAVTDFISRHNKYKVVVLFWETFNNSSFPLIWLILNFFIALIANQLGFGAQVLIIVSSLLLAWVIIQFATMFVKSEFWSNTIAYSAWTIAALNIVGLLEQTITALDNISFSPGQVNISILTILQAIITLGILLWITSIVGQITESRLRASKTLTPSMQVLSIKFVHIGLGVVAFFTALAVVGVDLTALAVLGGAVGVGLGFGLQKIFANLVSGFILLMDKSIKPGDVIAVGDYYGRVDSLGARYVSVWTRDGIEHLIPNEEIIINRVENWSHTQNLLRIKKTVGVHYKSDVKKARQLCLEAMDEAPRVLKEPEAVCHFSDFGDSSLDLEVRFWIDDPMNGRANVTSDVLMGIWDKFHEHGIEIPYPQRDLHLRTSDIGKLPPNENQED